MTATRSSIHFTPAFLASGLLHGALVLGFVIYAIGASPVVPLGSTMEISMVEMPAASPVAASVAPAPSVAKALAKPAPAPEQMALPSKKVAPVETAASAAAASAASAATAATKSAPGPVGIATGQEVAEMERYLFELRVTLEKRKTYPSLSRRLREAGEVLVEFKVKKDGSLEAVNVLKESSFARLNDAAIQLVASLGKFRPFPEGSQQAELSVKLPIRYALE
ncbi:MAG: energy transducer TonB [Proteobacteria bacterium]|nr:MAG: energy transducer TonB [Pseudomonadota bacterium]